MSKWFCPKIESTLLKRHKASCSEESAPKVYERKKGLISQDYRRRKSSTYTALLKTCLNTGLSTPSKLNITSCVSKSNKQPKIAPECHTGNW